MLRSLVNEVVSRRMWPIPLVAIVVAVAAPLLFMKSGGDTPASLAPPPVVQPGELAPATKKLVSSEDKSAASGAKIKSKSQDPFAPPKGKAAAGSDPAAPAAAPAATASSSGAGAVVIQNSDGSTSTQAVPVSTQRASAPKATTASTPKASRTRKSTTTRKKTTTAKKTTPARTVPVVTSTYVDVRFGARQNTYRRFRVPRLQTFRAGGRIAAIFVGYSSRRNAAVFAVAPSTQVKGDGECRTVKGVCRYVDLRAGKYVRLVLRGTAGKLISRRLDVVSIRTLGGKEDAAPRENTLDTATCLLKRLLKLTPSAPSITSGACA